jgi:hypothetical protein
MPIGTRDQPRPPDPILLFTELLQVYRTSYGRHCAGSGRPEAIPSRLYPVAPRSAQPWPIQRMSAGALGVRLAALAAAKITARGLL